MNTHGDASAPTMSGEVIALLTGDRPTETDRMLHDAAIAIRDDTPDLEDREALEAETLLAWGVHLAGNLPSIAPHAAIRVRSRFALRSQVLDGVDTTAEACRVIDLMLSASRAARAAGADGTAASRLQAMTEEQKALHPRLGLTLGYIGNCDLSGGRFDDRSWMVFAKLATPSCRGGCDIHFGNVPTRLLGRLMQQAETGLAAWCDEQERRLDAGEIRVVG